MTADGGEIGRAQALQALACRTPASGHMNPVLLKPQSDVGAQLVVRGKMRGNWTAANYQERKTSLLEHISHELNRGDSQGFFDGRVCARRFVYGGERCRSHVPWICACA